MNRPATARPRAPLVAALAAGAAMLVAACSVASPSSPASDPAPTASASAGLASASAASPSPTTSAPPSPTASPSQPASLPADWLLCTNSHVGFEIGYPAAWYTAELNPQQACQQFHPIAFTIPVDGEYPLTALNAVQTTEVFDPDSSGKGDPAFVSTLLREQTSVGGRRAVRFEESLYQEGGYPIGTRKYGYVIDRDGREFLVFTIAVPAEVGYEDWKPVLDQAVETLRFP